MDMPSNKGELGRITALERCLSTSTPFPGRSKRFFTSDEHTPQYVAEKFTVRKRLVFGFLECQLLRTTAQHACFVCSSSRGSLAPFPQQSTLGGEEEHTQLSLKTGVTLQKSVVCAFLIYSVGHCPKHGFSPKTTSRLMN